nr:WYL domain-containing protein [Roseateles chitosanitabidus]
MASVGGRGRSSRRTVRPLAIVYVDHALVLMAWCCLREGFRKFRVDRIATAETTGDSFRPRRASLLRACLAEMSK